MTEHYPDSARSLADLLGLDGYGVSVAQSAREALELADREPPDVAVLDIRLPDLDG